MKNTVKLTLILVLLFLVIVTEIILRINSNQSSTTVTTVTPTKTINNAQNVYNNNQPTTETVNEEENEADDIGTTTSIDSEVGPTLTKNQSEEVIETNEKTGGFHSFIAPDDNGSDIPETTDE